MYSVRKLIQDSYRASTVRGAGDVPDSVEVEEALVRLNDIMDELSGKPEFAHSKKSVTADTSKGFVAIGENGTRDIVSGSSNANHQLVITTRDPHGLSATKVVYIFVDGLSAPILTTVSSVTSNTTFVTGVVSQYSGVFTGHLVCTSDADDGIDIFDVPPANIYQVIDGDGNSVPEMQEQGFYSAKANGSSGKWWFYDKRYAPYPKVWVNGCDSVTIVYEEPFWSDLAIDTDLENMPKSARTALKWLLASALAEENGYLDIAERLEKRGKSVLMDWYRNNWQDASPSPDNSAPGYTGGRYNIYTDG